VVASVTMKLSPWFTVNDWVACAGELVSKVEVPECAVKRKSLGFAVPLATLTSIVSVEVGIAVTPLLIWSVYVLVEELDPAPLPLLTAMVNVEVPFVLGVPEMVVVAPVAAVFNERLAGRLPEAILHVNGPLAVVDAVIVCEYATVDVPFSKEDAVGVIVIGAGV